ncbi:MAG: DUF4389 domain-containing protein [Acidiferrobacterales bacterium]
MDEELKQNITEHGTWIRAFYMIIFFLVYSVAEAVLAAVVIFQFLSRLFTGKINEKLLALGANLSMFAYEILMFLTYNSETKPFPFGDWPQNTTNRESPAKNVAKRNPKKKSPESKSPESKSKVTTIKKDDSGNEGESSGI